MASDEGLGWGDASSSSSRHSAGVGWAGADEPPEAEGGAVGWGDTDGSDTDMEATSLPGGEGGAVTVADGAVVPIVVHGGGAPPAEVALWVEEPLAEFTLRQRKSKLKESYELVRVAKASMALSAPAVAAIADALVGGVAEEEGHPDGEDADGGPDSGDEPEVADAALTDPGLGGALAVPEWGRHVAAVRLEGVPSGGVVQLCEALESFAGLVSRTPSAVSAGISAQWKVSSSEHFLQHKKRQMGMMAEAEQLGVTRLQYQTMLQACACSGILAHRSEAARSYIAAHQQLLADGAQALSITEHLRYDETPMKSRLRDPERVALGPIGYGADVVAASGPAQLVP